MALTTKFQPTFQELHCGDKVGLPCYRVLYIRLKVIKVTKARSCYQKSSLYPQTVDFSRTSLRRRSRPSHKARSCVKIREFTSLRLDLQSPRHSKTVPLVYNDCETPKPCLNRCSYIPRRQKYLSPITISCFKKYLQNFCLKV
jgi:hypothetical protein